MFWSPHDRTNQGHHTHECKIATELPPTHPGMENVGKPSARVDFFLEEREHYKKIQKYKLHQPCPLKAWTPLTWTKDMDNWNGGCGNLFWPDQREQADTKEVICKEVCACEGTFLPDVKGTTPAWIKKKNSWACLKRAPTTSSMALNMLEPNTLHKTFATSTQELTNT
jgi:hypothetical protein